MINSTLTQLLERTGEARWILFRDIETLCSIGIHDYEKAAPQRILINLEVLVNTGSDHNDDIAKVLDYDAIHNAVMHLTASGHYHLQETLCDAIADACFEYPHVQAITVQTEKPDVYPHCRSVGYRLARVRKAVTG